MGEMIAARGSDDCLCYDWFFDNAKEKFGEKRVNKYIGGMSKQYEAIITLSDALLRDRISTEFARELRQLTEDQEEITVDILVQAARSTLPEEYPRGAIIQYRRTFMKTASDTQIMELANAVLREEDEEAKALLLLLFWCRPFPADITPLLQYVQSDNEHLAEAAVDTLKQTKDKRIHDIAIEQLKEKGMNSFVLGLLIKNYKKTDDQTILKALKRSASIPHHVQIDINDIYTRHRSENALPILLRVYQKGECTLCRCNTVKAMKHCGVLPERILEECLYDSYDETRKMAQRIKNRRM
jgi:hypothetical protein